MRCVGVVVVLGVMVPAAWGQEPLPLNKVVEDQIGEGAEFADYRFTAREAGVLTVAVRVPESLGTNDLNLSVLDQRGGDLAVALFGFLGSPAYADDDLDGDTAAEQIAATIPAPGDYLVRVGTLEGPGSFQIVAGFLPFPAAAREVPPFPEPEPLALGEPVLADLEPEQLHLYDVPVDRTGMLTVVTRGSGDVSLIVLGAPSPGVDTQWQVLAGVDGDQRGLGANESIIVDVEAGMPVRVLAQSHEASRYVILADLITPSELMEDLRDKAMQAPPHPLLGRQVPDLSFTNLEGETVRLRELTARVVLLDIWATWCPPCVKSLPDVQKVHEWAVQSKLPVAVYALNVEEEPEQVRSFLRRQRLELPVLLDEQGQVNEAFAVDAIPTTVIIADGVIRRIFVGAMPDHEKRLRTAVESLLQE